jgi:hypothetical protein
MKLLEKILRKLFPKTIDKIINDEIHNSSVIYHYGSFENYNKKMQQALEYAEEEERYRKQEEAEGWARYDQYLAEKYDLDKSIPKNKTN